MFKVKLDNKWCEIYLNSIGVSGIKFLEGLTEKSEVVDCYVCAKYGAHSLDSVQDILSWWLWPVSRDNGNDFSFPFPFPFPKLNDNDEKLFQNGYPKILNRLFSFPITQIVSYFPF